MKNRDTLPTAGINYLEAATIIPINSLEHLVSRNCHHLEWNLHNPFPETSVDETTETAKYAG